MDRELPSPAARADMLEAEEMSDPTFPRICVLRTYVVSDASFAPGLPEDAIERNIFVT